MKSVNALINLFIAVLVCVVMTSPAMAFSRIFPLHFDNPKGNQAVAFTITDQGMRCYEGSVGARQQIGPVVAGGKRVTVTLARIQGHGCDGQQGDFTVSVSGYPGVLLRFSFDNGGILALSNAANVASIGTLSAKQPDQSYIFTMKRKDVLTASKPVGEWAFVCQQVCNKVIKTEITNSKTKTTETSSEVKNALSVSLSAGVEFGAGSANTSITASQEKTVGQRMSEELSSSGTSGEESRVVFTVEQMEERDIFAVYQWVVKTTLSNGSAILLKTAKYTCVPGANKPTYLPGSKEDIASCRKK